MKKYKVEVLGVFETRSYECDYINFTKSKELELFVLKDNEYLVLRNFISVKITPLI